MVLGHACGNTSLASSIYCPLCKQDTYLFDTLISAIFVGAERPCLSTHLPAHSTLVAAPL